MTVYVLDGAAISPTGDSAEVATSSGANCVSRTQMPVQGVEGTIEGFTDFGDHLVIADMDGVRLWYPNRGAEPFTISPAIEAIDGTPYRVTFAGQPTITVQPHTAVGSDVLGLRFSARDRIRSRTFWQTEDDGTVVNAAAIFPTASLREGRAVGDVTMDADPEVTVGGDYIVVPTVIAAEYTDAPASVVVVGDSIAANQSEGANGDQRGWVERGLARLVPMLNLGIPGDSAVGFLAASRVERMPMIRGTHFLYPFGRNDLNTGSTTDLQADMLAGIEAGTLRGMEVIVTTVTPSSASSDGFLTVENQTAHASNPNVQAYNAWLRAGAPLDSDGAAVEDGAEGAIYIGDAGHPIDHLADVAVTVEYGTTGKWGVDPGPVALSEGLHPHTAGYVRMGEALDMRWFGFDFERPPVLATPAEILGGAIWALYDADGLSGTVNTLTDTSGNGRNVPKGSVAPDLIADAINSRKALDFTTADADDMYLDSADLPQPWDVVAVAVQPSGVTNGYTSLLDNLFDSFDGISFRNSPNGLTMNYGTALTTSAANAASWGVFRFNGNGISSRIFKGDNLLVTGNAGANAITKVHIGNGDNLRLAFLLIVNRTILADEWDDLLAFFDDRFAV